MAAGGMNGMAAMGVNSVFPPSAAGGAGNPNMNTHLGGMGNIGGLGGLGGVPGPAHGHGHAPNMAGVANLSGLGVSAGGMGGMNGAMNS